MRTESSILVRGDPERIFELAAAIDDWPRILPHYRYVVVDERSDTHKLARMGASRDGLPVSWRTRQDLRPAERRILFEHTGGVTRGMKVEWRIEPEGDAWRVAITHELRYGLPVLGPLFARYVVGRLFIDNIAGKTLACIKARVEAEARAGAGSSSRASGP